MCIKDELDASLYHQSSKATASADPLLHSFYNPFTTEGMFVIQADSHNFLPTTLCIRPKACRRPLGLTRTGNALSLPRSPQTYSLLMCIQQLSISNSLEQMNG